MPWATQVRGKPVSSLTREDVIAYEAFLTRPPAAWCDANLSRRGEHRRLFVGPLAAHSRRRALGILAGLFSHLVRAGYLAGSSFVLQRRRARRKTRHTIERYLDRALWEAVPRIVDGWSQETVRERQRYEHVRWALRFLYETALRAAEAAAACEGDFQHIRGRWWLHIVGKGSAESTIPLSDGLMEDFARYRRFCRQPAMPALDGKTPAILGIAGKPSSLASTAVYQIVKDTFRRVANTLQQQDGAKLRVCGGHRRTGCGIRPPRIRPRTAHPFTTSSRTYATVPLARRRSTFMRKKMHAMPGPRKLASRHQFPQETCHD